ncbi:MAG: hypothetical protein ACRCYX_01275 [Dermatophilaceae bacterium]
MIVLDTNVVSEMMREQPDPRVLERVGTAGPLHTIAAICLFRGAVLDIVCNRQMASHGTTTVRVRRPDSERLRALARNHQTTVVDVLHSAIDALERQDFLRGLHQDYQRLHADPERWEQHVAERREWDTLG